MATPAQSGVPKLLLIDSNVFFAKRLADALKKEGFDVMHATQSAYALTIARMGPPARDPLRHQHARDGRLRAATDPACRHQDRAHSRSSPWAKAATRR